VLLSSIVDVFVLHASGRLCKCLLCLGSLTGSNGYLSLLRKVVPKGRGDVQLLTFFLIRFNNND